MESKSKVTAHIVNNGKACISSELTDLIYDKVEKKQVFRIENVIKLSTPEKKRKLELDEEQ